MEDDLMTFRGLEKWYCKEFEKAGWVILAVSHGHYFKALMYRHSIVHLNEAIRRKISTVQNPDNRQDLEIMARNTDNLLQFVDMNLGEALRRAEERGFEERQYKGYNTQFAPISQGDNNLPNSEFQARRTQPNSPNGGGFNPNPIASLQNLGANFGF